MDNDALRKLTKATEERKRAELERKATEEEKLKVQQEKLVEEQRRTETLSKIITATELIMSMLATIEPIVYDNSKRTRIVLEFIKLIINWIYEQGSEEAERLGNMMESVRGDSYMRVNISENRDVHTGDFLESSIKADEFIQKVDRAKQEIEKGNAEEAESILNSLPEDIIDIAIAALAGPLNVAGVTLKKIGDKIKLHKE